MKNANIKSKEEALKRMIDGEKFYYKGNTLYYSWQYKTFYSDAGRIDEGRLNSSYLENYFEWMLPIYWDDAIQEKGILCFVSDSMIELETIRVITERNELDLYVDKDGNMWKYAIPLTLEVIKEYIYDNI